MDTEKSTKRKNESTAESTGDRRTGSVGERPELTASTIGGDRRAGSTSESKKRSIEDEFAGDTTNDPGLGGT
ncbi:MAG: hypothetical protein JOZ45_13895 [Acidobacteriaceae bacterium]|nr:hypothetical protein [Acidobacteriaceae bacterium]MBV9227194.1 hypothetical protein [Acidobacteriaceae bacterium]MBV9307234.1 hypothetical protein [Acidobacteriaceae bacterium]MBV9939389.1 hypothetical protein [Acidobacteriaceae bacterium]